MTGLIYTEYSIYDIYVLWNIVVRNLIGMAFFVVHRGQAGGIRGVQEFQLADSIDLTLSPQPVKRVE
jgi:hypothetical protein